MAKLTATKRVTREDLEYYYALEEDRLKLQRQVDDIKKLQGELEDKFEAHVVAHGGKEKSVVTCGYRLFFVLKSAGVKWKDQFLRVAKLAGLDPLEESERITAATPKKEELRIEPPPEPEG